MHWKKQGLIFKADHHYDWMVSHATLPVPADLVDDQHLRIYFGVRDNEGRSLTTYINVLMDNLQQVDYIHDKPILPLGKLGTFDDNGKLKYFSHTYY